MKAVIEVINGLQYNLRMMGFTLDREISVYCENSLVVKFSTMPESTLRKYNSICYHLVRESCSIREISIGYKPSETNIVDVLTNIVLKKMKKNLIQKVVY